jgi:hypothetical protein
MEPKNRLVDIVVAKYKEDVSWTNIIKYNVIIYDKSSEPLPNSIQLPNIGREAHTYLYHIVNNYDDLADYTIFLQGNPWDHAYKLLPESTNIKCAEYINNLCFPQEFQGFLQDPGPHDVAINLTKHSEIITKRNIFNVPIPINVDWVAGAQYIVPKKNILSRPLEFYKKLLKMSETNTQYIDEEGLLCAWGFERLWITIFNSTIEMHDVFC